MIVLQISACCYDDFNLAAYDNTDITSEEILVDYTGKVPRSTLGGYYNLNFSIDNATGRILNWKPLDLDSLHEN